MGYSAVISATCGCSSTFSTARKNRQSQSTHVRHKRKKDILIVIERFSLQRKLAPVFNGFMLNVPVKHGKIRTSIT